MLFEFALIVLIFRSCQHYHYQFFNVDETPSPNNEGPQNVADDLERKISASFSTGKSKNEFEDAYESFAPCLRYFLFLTRFLSFYYICGVSVSANYFFMGQHQWYYFSSWNALLLSVYFMLATCASILGFVYGIPDSVVHLAPDESDPSNNYSYNLDKSESESKSKKIIWSAHSVRFGQIIHVLFEVCCGSSLLVIASCLLVFDSESGFWNLSVNLAPLLTLLLELLLNNMYVSIDHYPYNLSWAFLYLIFIWPVVVMNKISFWPYAVLSLERNTCYFWYTLLVLTDTICYFIFCFLSFIKRLIRSRIIYRNDKDLINDKNNDKNDKNDIKMHCNIDALKPNLNQNNSNNSIIQHEFDESKSMHFSEDNPISLSDVVTLYEHSSFRISSI